MTDPVNPIVSATQGRSEDIKSQSQRRLDKTGNFDANEAAQKAANIERGLSRSDAFSIDEARVVSEEATMARNIRPATSTEAGTIIGSKSVDSEYWQGCLDFTD